MNQPETIAALATPNGMSALAIVRISGSKSFEIVSKCLLEKKKFTSAHHNRINLYTLVDLKTKSNIDEITAIKYSAPKSFTGEDMVEIICHGGPRIVEEIATTILDAGAMPAGRGEFSRRAFENGKIDLFKAEAIKGIIESTGDIELACAKKLYKNNYTSFKKWREKLEKISSFIEANIEFEETINEGKTINELDSFLNEIKNELKKKEKIRNVEKGITVVIAGPANTGKSSIFNSLVGKERTIVHHEPGTTRDVISENIWICGYQVVLIDSAGIRDTINEIEKKGIIKSKEEIENASIILWVTDANEKINEKEIEEIKKNSGKEMLGVINKIDLDSGKEKKEFFIKNNIETIEISVKTGEKIKKLNDKIALIIQAIHKKIEIPDVFLNKRHEEIGNFIFKEIKCTKNEWERPEIAAVHLKNAINKLDELIGKTDNENVLNNIFNQFCVGK
jgi:tRNA modification GTPase